MKSADYRAWLERELTHEAAGRALGVHKSTSKRYGGGGQAHALSVGLKDQAVAIVLDLVCQSGPAGTLASRVGSRIWACG